MRKSIASRHRSRCSIGVTLYETSASQPRPSGRPATSRPPLMQSRIAYSSAIRIGGVAAIVAPSWTIATSS
jgi:hypothetical protein